MGISVGFEPNYLLYPASGLNTYAVQLLHHLQQLDAPLEITLLDGTGYSTNGSRIRGQYPGLRGMRFVSAHQLPYFHVNRPGHPWPWMRNAAGQRLARRVDGSLLDPLWRWVRSTPFPARLLFPPAATHHLDVCHWSQDVFLPVSGIPTVTTVFDLIPLRHPEWVPAGWATKMASNYRLIAAYSTRIICLSESARGDLVSLLDVPDERIDVIPAAVGAEFRPVDDTQVVSTLASYGLTYKGYLLYVGSIEPRKNLVRLATAFKLAMERREDRTTKLVLAGQLDWATQPIRNGLEAAALGAQLVLPGRIPHEHLPSLISGARAVTYVSLYEGFGLPPLEAMACGTPVLAASNSSIPEVVEDACLLVDPYNVEEIAAALQRIVSDDALCRQLSARGFHQAAKFSWARTAELTMGTYRSAIRDRRKTAVARACASVPAHQRAVSDRAIQGAREPTL